jgi:signal transduction histidine kinase
VLPQVTQVVDPFVAGEVGMNVIRLVIDAMIIVITLLAIQRLADKATLPEDAPTNLSMFRSERVPITMTNNASTPSLSGEYLNYILARHQVGDRVSLVERSTGEERTFTLKAEYTWSFIALQLVVSLVFCGLGLFVLFAQRSSPSACAFHDMAWSTTAVLSCTTVQYLPEGDAFSGIMAALHAVSYAFFCVMLVRFTTTFPATITSSKWIMRGMIALGGVLGIGGALSGYSYGASSDSTQWASLASSAATWMSWVRVLFMISAVISLSSLVYTVRTTKDSRHHKQAWWVLYGASVSIVGTVVLWIAPLVLFDIYLVPEWVLLLLVVVAPITFAVAVVRYRALDISIVVRRSTTYAIIALVMVSSIVITSRVISSIFIDTDENLSHPGAWLIIGLTAMLYEPLRKRVQRFVDQRLFGVQYDLREAKTTIARTFASTYGIRDVANELTSSSELYFKPERVGVFRYAATSSMLAMVCDTNFSLLRGRRIPFDALHVNATLLRPVARVGLVESDLDVESADPVVFDRWGVAMAIPLTGVSGSLLGFLVLGPKRSSAQYTEQDVELAREIGLHAGHSWERIELQHALQAEQAEAERLAEVSALKTMFVSSVSHDLKTPITAIRLYAEMSGTTTDPSTLQRNMEVIVGESARLTHMIDNILGIARSEQSVQQVTLHEIDMNDVIESTASLLRYLLAQTQTTLRISIPEEPVFVRGNQDLMVQALMNILENAMKYARDDRRIEIELTTTDDHATCTVTDHGPGFRAEDLPRLFEPFYRSQHHVTEERVSGTGLGLAIVEHVARVHRGTVHASNAPSGGACITLQLPRSVQS